MLPKLPNVVAGLLVLCGAAVTAVHAASSQLLMLLDEDYSLKAPFDTSAGTKFITTGDVSFVNNIVRLGNRISNQSGSLWTKAPNKFVDWQLKMSFKITGAPTAGGNGLALWYSKEAARGGPVFGSTNRWNGLGVFVDTYDNDGRGKNPIIMGMLNSGNTDYLVYTDGANQSFGECLRNVRNTPRPVHIKITYLNKMLKVEVDEQSDGLQFQPCMEKYGVELPSDYYFGLSVSNNHLPDAYEVHSFEVFHLKPLQAETPKAAESADKAPIPPVTTGQADAANTEAIAAAIRQGQLEDEVPRKIKDLQAGLTARLDQISGQLTNGDRATESRLIAIDSKLADLKVAIASVQQSFLQLGSQVTSLQNSRQVLDALNQANLQVMTKLKQLEDHSITTHDRTSDLHVAMNKHNEAIHNKANSSHWFSQGLSTPMGYLILIVLQAFLLLGYYTLQKKYREESKKFL